MVTLEGVISANSVPHNDDVVLRDSHYDDFYRANYRPVVGLGFVLTGSLSAAEDLAQEAFLAAHRQWAKLVDYDDPGAWVRRVVANRAVSRRRRKGSELRALTRLRSRRADPTIIETGDPELWEAVRALPKRQAQVIALVYVNDCTAAQAAETLGIGVETARTHLQRAKANLARQLDERTGPTGDQPPTHVQRAES